MGSASDKSELTDLFIDYMVKVKGDILNHLPALSKDGRIIQASKATIDSRERRTKVLTKLFSSLFEEIKKSNSVTLNSILKVKEHIEILYRNQKRGYGFFSKLFHAGSLARFDNSYARLVNYLSTLAKKLYAKQVESKIDALLEEIKSGLLFSPQVRQRSQLIDQISELKKELNQKVTDLKPFDERLFNETIDFMVCQRARISAVNYNFVKIYKDKMKDLEKDPWTSSKVQTMAEYFFKAFDEWLMSTTEKIWKSPEEKLSKGEMYGGPLNQSPPYIQLIEKLESNQEHSSVVPLLKGHLSLYADKTKKDIDTIGLQLESLKKIIQDHPLLK